MLEGFFFLFFFSLYLLAYPIRLYRRHKHNPKSEHKPKVFYPLVEKTFRDLEYDYFGESTAEVDLDDEDS
jgi:hypothetical protein